MKNGFLFLMIYYLANFVAYKQAKASFPSTLNPAIPEDNTRGIIPSDAYWSSTGVDIAYLLLRHINKVCDFKVAAKFTATPKSP